MVSGSAGGVGLPMTYSNRSLAAFRSPYLACSTSCAVIAFMSASVTASIRAWRRAAVWRAKGLPGPPGLPLVKRPRASRPGSCSPLAALAGGSAGAGAPLAPFADGSARRFLRPLAPLAGGGVAGEWSGGGTAGAPGSPLGDGVVARPLGVDGVRRGEVDGLMAAPQG